MLATLTPLDWKRRAVKYYPEKIAVIDGDKKFTYKEFGNRVDRLSIALHNAGIKEKEHVAVMLPNNHAMLECFYGIPDRKSTRLNSSHVKTPYAVFCLKKKITTKCY